MSINAVRGGIFEENEAANDMKSIQPPEGNHHLNLDPIEVSVDHDGGDGSNWERPTNTEQLDAVDGVEGDTLELAHVSTSPDVEAGASGTITDEHSKEADKTSPQICYDSTVDNQQEGTVTGHSTIDGMGRVDDSEGNQQEACIQGSGVSSEVNSNGSLGIENSGKGETLDAEDVPELGKSDDTFHEAVPLPTESKATEKRPNNEDFCEDKNDMFEVGCVLVEFRRTEASCMAAHCLHGRAFDDRIVTVEYVPLNAYREKFPK